MVWKPVTKISTLMLQLLLSCFYNNYFKAIIVGQTACISAFAKYSVMNQLQVMIDLLMHYINI